MPKYSYTSNYCYESDSDDSDDSSDSKRRVSSPTSTTPKYLLITPRESVLDGSSSVSDARYSRAASQLGSAVGAPSLGGPTWISCRTGWPRTVTNGSTISRRPSRFGSTVGGSAVSRRPSCLGSTVSGPTISRGSSRLGSTVGRSTISRGSSRLGTTLQESRRQSYSPAESTIQELGPEDSASSVGNPVRDLALRRHGTSAMGGSVYSNATHALDSLSAGDMQPRVGKKHRHTISTTIRADNDCFERSSTIRIEGRKQVSAYHKR
ncbi:predicted protein [Uncinocarpus reesii 1704]|uniref:Uncharacterized protein n=1 Tax=Uncinocarpus reesii (strain UAMH 1704) TaxID=336963 RepID=C4JH02_UNCRE|nr:uncharacterized protein UREG_01253 [Uncinocarpus reesii 1704]EEP76404.1 predicted protein [Uncinocarpus reesii 1704]